MKVNSKKIASNFILFGIYFLFSILTDRINKFSSILLIYNISLHLIILYNSRRSQVLTIFWVFSLTYSLYLIPYFFMGVFMSSDIQFQTSALTVKTLNLHTLFVLLIHIFSKRINPENIRIIDTITKRKNDLIFYPLIVLIILITLTSIRGRTLLDGAIYGETGAGSSLTEYVYILYIVSFLYSHGKKEKLILLCVGFFYFFRVMLFGGRIAGLQMVLLIFLLFYENRFSNFLIYIGSMLGLLAMETLGALRFGITKINFFDFSKGLFVTNQTDIFYSSLASVGLIDNGIYDFSFRLKSFLGFLLGIFIPSKYTFPEANLPVFTQQHTYVGGGGLISVWLYVWLGVVGVVTISILISHIMNCSYENTSVIFKTYIILLFSTYPRWYGYTPINIFKMGFYCVIFTYIIKVFDRTICRYLKGNKNEIQKNPNSHN